MIEIDGLWLRLVPMPQPNGGKIGRLPRLQVLVQRGQRWRIVIDEVLDRFDPGVISHFVTDIGIARRLGVSAKRPLASVDATVVERLISTGRRRRSRAE